MHSSCEPPGLIGKSTRGWRKGDFSTLARILGEVSGALWRRVLVGAVVGVVAACGACGPSPAPAAQERAPSGTLVVVIQHGPERVPFEPKVDRVRRANEQLTRLLGHSIQIELDGALLPQTHDGAQDVIARLVEDVARELDALAKEDPKVLAFARASFERLVVRYAPSEAAAREERWRRSTAAKLDAASKTIDLVRAEARWLALGRGEISSVLFRAFAANDDERYGRVLPDALPPAEHRSWFEHHARGRSSGTARKEEPFATIGSVHGLRVRGMVLLHTLATRGGDGALAADVQAWLVNAISDFASTYHHHAVEVESAPQASPYRVAETAYVGWLRAELPKMTLDERAKIATHLWVIDFRKDHAERDRFATYAFPGLDVMAFSFDAVDAWIAAGHPPKPGSRELHPLFDAVVCPAVVEDHDGQLRFSHPGRCDGDLHRWALADRTREDVLVKGVIARGDVPFATAVFYNARRALRDESDYLRFLRRFEQKPALWKAGADVHREVVHRPSTALLEESRRLWREMPAARGHVLLWFTRHADGSYHPESDWPDLVQGAPADEAALTAYLDLGRIAFELLPAAWPGLAKTSTRIRIVTAHAKRLLSADIRARPGGRSVAGTLAAVARVLCDERSMPELAELRSFAQAELASRPGAGLSEVVEAADATKCTPKPRPSAPKKPAKKPSKTPPVDDPLFPKKAPLPEDER